MKRIVFVDDEVELLDSLRARLYKRRGQWEMVFLNSGAQVVEELEKQPADLIVSDVRMPGVDGGELLRQLRERWPQTIRIVLSGYADQMQTLKLVSLAHQYISKPCDAQYLENVIERCLNVYERLHRPELRSLLGGIGSLPPAPKIYSQLQKALSDDNVSINGLAELVAHDPVIATKVLQVVNSAFFRLAKPMTSIKSAVSYLGFNAVRNLVLSAEVFSQWQTLRTVPGFSLDRLQEHALKTAAACRALCVDTPQADDAWLAGLVHDIGYWILLKECPNEFAQVMNLMRQSRLDSCTAEQEVFGATHAEMGAYLLGLWGLPYALVEAVAMHHTPMQLPPQGFELLAVLATAHSLVPASEAEQNELAMSSEWRPVILEQDFNSFNPPFDWHEARRRVQQACLPEAS